MRTLPHLLVHEYVTGGGWPEAELPAGLAAEAFAMLQAVLADLKAWGGVQTTTTRDRRLAGRPLPATQVVELDPSEHQDALLDLAAGCDVALLIAPEADQVLASLTGLLEAAGVPLLGSSAAGVALAADKWQCYHLFRGNGIPTPETWRVEPGQAVAQVQAIGFPLVVKPRWGAGAEGVCLVTDLTSLEPALALAGQEGHGRQVSGHRMPVQPAVSLLQRFVPGIHASASLLVQAGEVCPLSLNGQRISAGLPFAYHGGCIPLEHPLAAQALALAGRAAALVPGLKGYVGVDLVLTETTCTVIEINPRLTTSYVGLRRVTDTGPAASTGLNLGQAIWEAGRYGRLPSAKHPAGTGLALKGRVIFNKDGTDG